MDPTLIIFGIRALIRLAAPPATQDALTRKLMVIQGQVGSSEKLPPARLEPVQQLFDGLETQYDKVSELRGGVFALADGVATDCRTIPVTQSLTRRRSPCLLAVEDAR